MMMRRLMFFAFAAALPCAAFAVPATTVKQTAATPARPAPMPLAQANS